MGLLLALALLAGEAAAKSNDPKHTDKLVDMIKKVRPHFQTDSSFTASHTPRELLLPRSSPTLPPPPG